MEDLAGTAAADPEIPNKLYFRIGEVARLAGIKPYVLRFWETEFGGLGPRKSGAGHRLYRRQDVGRLLYDQRFTIEGARKFLETRPKAEAASSSAKTAKAASSRTAKKQGDLFDDSAPVLELVRKELLDILRLLK